MQDGISRSYHWINLALLPLYVIRPLAIIALMALAFAAGYPTDAVTAMTAAVIATWATTIGQLLTLNRRLAATIVAGTRSYDIGKWFMTSIPIFVVGGFYYLPSYTDVLVLQEFRSPDEVAIYFAATKIIALIAFVYFSVSAATAHKFAEYGVSEDRDQLVDFLASSIRWTFWPSLGAAALVLAVGRPLLWLFGPQFVEGYSILFILCIGLLARAAVGPVERLLNMLGEQQACALVYAGAFAVNLILCIVLIPPLGLNGAAVSCSAALIVESIALFCVTKRRLGLHVFIWGPWKRHAKADHLRRLSDRSRSGAT